MSLEFTEGSPVGREAIFQFAEAIGHRPADVMSLTIMPNSISVQEFDRTEDGKLQLAEDGGSVAYRLIVHRIAK